ncbi:MAG: response regulator transcription factor [Ruminococcaceae bacterium]|nr:response regulator transcription factor [Oscillospiraceae bacterium]
MEEQKKKILIVEDEKTIAEILLYNIKAAGYDAETRFDGKSGLEEALTGKYDLILLDLMLPLMDGFEVCEKVRERLDTPIIMLTARDTEQDKIRGLDTGADDYMTKPFSINELLSRVRANIRRYSNETVMRKIADSTIVISDIVIDCENYLVKKGDKILELSKKEYDLLAYFAKNAGKVYTREELMSAVWGYENFYGDLRTIDVTIARLRQKIDEPGTEESIIQTKRGLGYFIAAKND